MPARNAEVEIIRYKTPELVHAAGQLVYNFTRYSGIVGQGNWEGILYQMTSIIKKGVSVGIRWHTSALDITFSGIPEPTVPKITKNGVIFAANEPHFVLEEVKNESIRPQQRAHVQRVTNAIAQEMHDVYHLQIDKDPLTLTFPKSEYAESIEVFNAAIIQPQLR